MFEKWFAKKETQENLSEKASFEVVLDRESVCMGDDVMSHKETRSFLENIKISEFIKVLVDYVPKMANSVWLIWGEQEIIGYIDFDASGNAKIEVEGEDAFLAKRFSTAEMPSITCIYYYSGKFSWWIRW